MKRSGAEAVVRALEDEGVPFTFGIPGTHNLELYDALIASRRVRPILVTDEQAASFMADAVWRASGRLGCVNLVPGAGFTHALSGVAEAWLDTVPLLVLACGVRRDTGRAFQLHDVDQAALAAPVTKARIRPLRGGELYGAVRRACRLAREGRPGPVMVEVPAELYLLRHEGSGTASPPPPPGGRATGAAAAVTAGGCGFEGERPGATGWEGGAGSAASGWVPRPSVAGRPGSPRPAAWEVEAAVGLLSRAERPLLYVGLGAAGAAHRLPELAERLAAPVSTTFQGKGVFPESHPLWLWPGFGATAPPPLRTLAGRCDATLALGCRFSEVGTGSWSFTPPRPLVHVDVDPDVFHRNHPADLAIRADATAFVEALLERLGTREEEGATPESGHHEGGRDRGGGRGGGPPAARTRLEEELASAHRDVRARQLEPSGKEGVTPGLLLARLQEIFGEETVFTTDSGNGTFLALEGLRLDAPGRFLAPVDFSCMGYAVPAAVGAALSRPEVPVVALAGDGAFLMTGLELLTAVREGAGLAVILLRDGELAQISQFQEVAYGRRSASRLADYDAGTLARALGVETLRIERDRELEEALGRAAALVARGRTVLVDTAVDCSGRSWFTRGVVRTTLGRLPWGERLRYVARALGRRVTG